MNETTRCDLRNELTVILLSLEELSDEQISHAGHKKALHNMQIAAEKMRKLLL